MARAGFDPASYAGRALLNVLESYPRDELFQIDEDDALPLRHRHHEPVRAPAHPGARPRRRVRPLRLGARLHPEGPLRHDGAPPRRRVPRRRLRGTRVGGLSGLSGRAARAHALHHRPRRGRDAAVDRDDARKPASPAIVRTWSDTPARRRSTTAIGGPQARALASALRRRLQRRLSRSLQRRRRRSATSTILERLSDARPRAVDLYRRERRRPRPRQPEGLLARRRAAAVRARAASGKPRLPASSTSAPTASRRRARPRTSASGCTTWRWSAPPAAPSTSPPSRGRSRRRSWPCSAGLPSRTDSIGSCSRPGSAGATSRWCARSGATCARSRVPYGQDYLALTLARHRAIATKIVALFYARFDPRAETGRARGAKRALRAEIEDRCSRRSRASTTTASCAASSTSSKRRCAPTSSRSTPTACRARPSPSSSNAPARRRPAAAQAALRDLRLFAARRGRAPALRQGGARRPALVGPAAGFPHRGAGARQGAAGQERRHRAGGRQGRLRSRSSLPPASDRQAWLAEGTESYRIFIRTLLQLTDNIVGDHVVPPPDTVRHDGDDPYLVVAADKGTATFSDIANAHLDREGPLARRRLRVRRQPGLRPQEDGHHRARRLGGGEASFPRDGRRHPVAARHGRRRRRHVGRRVRQRHAALARRSSSSPPSIIATSSSIPTPIRPSSWAERQRLFDLPRSSWQDYDKALISKGGGVFSRCAKSIPLSPRPAPLLGLDEAEATPAEVMSAILKAPVGLLWFGGIGTYVRAATETDEQVGDRANDAIRITGARGPRQGDRRRRESRLRRSAGRIEAARARRPPQHRRHRQLGRRQHLGRRGQHQDRARDAGARGPPRPRRRATRSWPDMTDEVAAPRAAQQLSADAGALARRSGAAPADLGFAQRLMQTLERQGRLDRAVEYLPDDAALTERSAARRGADPAGARGAPRLRQARAARRAARQPRAGRSLSRARAGALFPGRRCASASRTRSPAHRLRREIIATQLANAIVNRGGPTHRDPPRRPDRRGRADHRRRLCGDPRLVRPDRAERRDRRARRRRAGRAAAAPLRRAAGSADEPHRLVHPQRRFGARHRSTPWSAPIATGIAEVERTLPETLSTAAHAACGARARRTLVARRARRRTWPGASRPCRIWSPRPTSCSWPRGPGVRSDEVAPNPFRRRGHVPPRRAGRRSARAIPVADDYFDRLALDRAIDGIAAAHRRLTAEVDRPRPDRPGGGRGLERGARRRGPAHPRRGRGDLASGLTLSKLTVAASLLGDLVRE